MEDTEDIIFLKKLVLQDVIDFAYNDPNLYIFIYRGLFHNPKDSIPTLEYQLNSYLSQLYNTLKDRYAQPLEVAYDNAVAFGFITHSLLLNHPIVFTAVSHTVNLVCFCDFNYEFFNVDPRTIKVFFLLLNRILTFIHRRNPYYFKEFLKAFFNTRRENFSAALQNLKDNVLWKAFDDDQYSTNYSIKTLPTGPLPYNFYIYWLFLFQNDFTQFLYFADSLSIIKQANLVLEIPNGKVYFPKNFDLFYAHNPDKYYVFNLNSFAITPYYFDLLYEIINKLLSLLPTNRKKPFHKLSKKVLSPVREFWRKINTHFLDDYHNYYDPEEPKEAKVDFTINPSPRLPNPFDDGIALVINSHPQFYINWRVLFENIEYANNLNYFRNLKAEDKEIDLFLQNECSYLEIHYPLFLDLEFDLIDSQMLKNQMETSPKNKEPPVIVLSDDSDLMSLEDDDFTLNRNKPNVIDTTPIVPISGSDSSNKHPDLINKRNDSRLSKSDKKKRKANNVSNSQKCNLDNTVNSKNLPLITGHNNSSITFSNNMIIDSSLPITNNFVSSGNFNCSNSIILNTNAQKDIQNSSAHLDKPTGVSFNKLIRSNSAPCFNLFDSRELHDYYTLYNRKKAFSDSSNNFNSDNRINSLIPFCEYYLLRISFGLLKNFKENLTFFSTSREMLDRKIKKRSNSFSFSKRK